VVDEDGSTLSKSIVAGLQADPNLNITLTNESDAKDLVGKGTIGVGVILGQKFGEGSMRALVQQSGPKPKLNVFYDPSRTIEVGMVQGVVTQHVMQAIAQAAGVPRPSLPFTLNVSAKASNRVAYNAYAHSFAGMGIQF